MLNEIDAEWVERCKESPDKYKIMVDVDNDGLWVEEVGGDSVMHDFEEYGYEFAKSLLEHIGCSVDFV